MMPFAYSIAEGIVYGVLACAFENVKGKIQKLFCVADIGDRISLAIFYLIGPSKNIQLFWRVPTLHNFY